METLAPRVTSADAVVKTDETLTVTVPAEGALQAEASRSALAHLRVVQHGRLGWAGGEANDPEGLVEAALASAAAGDAADLFLPAPSPLPDVLTRSPQAAVAGVETLAALARLLRDRLLRDGRRVETWAERSAGAVRIANTRGLLAEYEVSMVGLGAVVGTADSPPCRVQVSGVVLPTLLDLEGLVLEVERRLTPPVLSGKPAPAGVPVCLAPRAVAAFLRPLLAALLGRAARRPGAPLAERLGEYVLSSPLSLLDDPLAPGRPGSRPLDDDGVPSRRIPLVERGRIVAFVSDVLSGARTGVPSTGHGWRHAYAPPAVGFTNLKVLPDVGDRADLIRAMGRGLLIEDLTWGAGANPDRGTFVVRAPWTYLVDGGVVRGRLEGVSLAGNVFGALSRVAAVGRDAAWIGACSTPSLVLEGIQVGRG